MNNIIHTTKKSDELGPDRYASLSPDRYVSQKQKKYSRNTRQITKKQKIKTELEILLTAAEYITGDMAEYDTYHNRVEHDYDYSVSVTDILDYIPVIGTTVSWTEALIYYIIDAIFYSNNPSNFRQRANRKIRRGALGFCGIQPVLLVVDIHKLIKKYKKIEQSRQEDISV